MYVWSVYENNSNINCYFCNQER